MKKFSLFALIFLMSFYTKAQPSPVLWTFTAKKIADKTFEIHMKAAIQKGWHLYSQNQPADAIAIPTNFTINKNPLLVLDGTIKEIGKLEKFHDAKLDLSASQYSNTVDFVQVVKLKAKAKTSFTGKLQYQTCDDEKCLPPKTINFNIAIK